MKLFYVLLPIFFGMATQTNRKRNNCNNAHLPIPKRLKIQNELSGEILPTSSNSSTTKIRCCIESTHSSTSIEQNDYGKKKKYTLGLPRFTKAKNPKDFFFNYSDLFVNIFYFQIIHEIFRLECDVPVGSYSQEDYQSIFGTLLLVVEKCGNQKYLSYFVFLKHSKNLITKFDFTIYVVLAFVYFSDNWVEVKLPPSFKEYLKNLIRKFSFGFRSNSIFVKICKRLNEKFKLGLTIEDSEIINYVPLIISLPFLNLIYLEKLNQRKRISNDPEKLFLKKLTDDIWGEIKKDENIETKKTLSKYYQLEFFDMICKISDGNENATYSKEKNKEDGDEKAANTNLFLSLIQLIKDFRFLSCDLSYRIMRRTNAREFERFVNAVKNMKFLDDHICDILECISEFKKFFIAQCAIYLYDFAEEIEKNTSNANNDLHFLESMPVFRKFVLICSLSITIHNLETNASVNANLVKNGVLSDDVLDIDLFESQIENISDENINFSFEPFKQNTSSSSDTDIQITTNSSIMTDTFIEVERRKSKEQQKAKSTIILDPMIMRIKFFFPNKEDKAIFDNCTEILYVFDQLKLQCFSFEFFKFESSSFLCSAFSRTKWLDKVESFRDLNVIQMKIFKDTLKKDPNFSYTKVFKFCKNTSINSKINNYRLDKAEIELLVNGYIEYFNVKYNK